MGILFLHRETPGWLERIADRIGTVVDPFDPRGITSRGDPLVLLLDTRGEDEAARCEEARTGFGSEAVVVAITETGDLTPGASAFADIGVPASERALLSTLPLALQLSGERRARRTAESQLAHAQKRPVAPQTKHSSPGFALANAAFSKARMGVLQLDAQLRCVVWNRFMELRTGVSATEILGRRLQDHPRLAPLGLENVAVRALSGETADGGEIRVDDPATGRPLFLHVVASPITDEASTPVSVVAVVHDRTPQRVAEELRRKAERGFRTLLDALPDVAVVSHSGRLVYGNALAATTFGFAGTADLVGLSLLDLFNPADHDTVRTRTEAVLSGEPVSPFETVARRVDGSIVILEISCVQVVFEGAPSLLCVARDVTERKLLQGQLAATDRLASMGMLAAGVAHEINNPLTALVSSLDFLNEVIETHPELKENEDIGDLLLTSQEATRRVRDIVRDLKVFSRPDEERSGSIDVSVALESTVRLARGEVRHKAKLAKDYRATPLVDGNVARLGQVFLNLVVNAAQAIPDGEADKHEITLASRTDAHGNAVVEVRDTGRGIPKEDLPRIFEPFFSTKPVGEGTGLGLAVCQRIISSLGGRIEVESDVGRGSVFRVVLPPSRRIPLQTPLRPRSMPPAKRGRVLVVDDDAAIRRTLTRILAPEHEVISVGSGGEAIDLVADGERFDVVLCDLMMPRVSGDQCWSKVSEIAPDQAARFVFVTGGAVAQTARAFLESTPCPTVDKPFDADHLRRAVRDVMRA
ncbi:MAG: PAS domain S-box protein [Myxococcales bacterium]|nr:PAS domain S-box protein [Myxococcales bacterium]